MDLYMTSALNDQSLDQILRSARTPNGWADRPVEDKAVREIYDLMKWGPTSANSSPARFVWVRKADGKATLVDCGPMSGFDNAGVDNAFFSRTRIESNFICSIGHGDPASVFPRNPRLGFEEAGRWA
jgi:nitroreductase